MRSTETTFVQVLLVSVPAQSPPLSADTGSTGLTLYTSAPLRIPRARRAMSSTDIACGFCADQPDPRLMRIPAIRMTAGEENEEKNQLLSGVTGLFLFRDAPAA